MQSKEGIKMTEKNIKEEFRANNLKEMREKGAKAIFEIVEELYASTDEGTVKELTEMTKMALGDEKSEYLIESAKKLVEEVEKLRLIYESSKKTYVEASLWRIVGSFIVEYPKALLELYRKEKEEI